MDVPGATQIDRHATAEKVNSGAGGGLAGRDRHDVIVLGAGVVGVATAYALARRGLKVALVDRAEGPARGCSHANGGQLSYVYTDALASPALLTKLPGLALGLDPVFRIRLVPDPEMLRWGLAFLRNCTESRFRQATLAGLTLGLESRLAMHELLAKHSLSFNHTAPGKLHLHYSDEALEAAAAIVALKHRSGVEQKVLSAAEACALEPAVGDARGLAGAIYSPAEEAGDPHLFARGLTELLARDYHVALHFGFDARTVETGPDRIVLRAQDGSEIAASRIVVALGPDAPSFLRRMGIRVPIMPMKGYSFTAPRGSCAPTMSITDSSRKLVFCPLGGEMRVAGFAELGRRDCRIDPPRVAQLIDSASASLPNAARYEDAGRFWAGLRPMTPSSLPIIEEARPNIFVNVGHGMLGWTFAMGSAERVASLVMSSSAASATARRQAA